MSRISHAALAAAVSLWVVSVSLPVAQERRGLTFVGAIEMPLVLDPQPSPDGTRIAFVLEGADWRANRRVGHIHLVNADGTGLQQVTHGDRGETSPRFSPDGRTLAFLARRDSDQHDQIYLLPLDGGEARRLTNHPAAPTSITWTPDGRSLLFLADDQPSAEEREKRRLQDDVYAFEEDNFQQRHLWSVDLAGVTRALTSGNDFSVTEFSLSRDGRRVAMMRAPSPLLEHMRLGEVWVMDLDGSSHTQLTTNQLGESGPELSPDGSLVLFTASADARFDSYYNDKIFTVPSTGGAARLVTPANAPYEVESATWSRDGRAILFTANVGVSNQFMRLDVTSGQVTPLSTGDHTLGGWSVSDRAGTFVFTRNGGDRPAEVFTMPVGGGAMRKVTAVSDDLLARTNVARQERLSWKGKDGQTVEGLLYYPLDYRPGQRYPLVVWTHGGPASSDKFTFSPEQQVYAARGYAVLKPNYRGSTGYGDVFLRDMVKGYFKNAHLDVLLGADAVIAMGVADPDRLLKTGWSAGGHMTNKIITVTDRFKAAVSGAGAANWISMYAQSDHRAFRTPWFGGTPWQQNAPFDLYWDHSPLKDIVNVKTPTLFLVGEQDPRVPLAQSLEMYRGLKHNGVTTKLLVAPRAGHSWTELRHKLHELNARMDWLETQGLKRAYAWEKGR